MNDREWVGMLDKKLLVQHQKEVRKRLKDIKRGTIIEHKDKPLLLLGELNAIHKILQKCEIQ